VSSRGWVDAHTHLYSGLAPLDMPRPTIEPRGFLEILETIWWCLDRALDASSLRAATRLYVAEALLQGTTALVDHHESPRFIEGSLDVLGDACQELGMRALLCYGATERNGGREEAQRGLAECRRFLDANTRPLVRGVVGLHASFTVSDQTLREAGELAREHDTVVHVHVAEDRADVEDARSRGYAGVLDRLLALDALPTGSILAHGVHLVADEVRRCAELGLWLVQNPRSNQANGVGYPSALTHSALVALGTDGYPADMVDEAEMLVLEAAAHGDDLDRAGARLAAGRRLVAARFPDGAARDDVGLGRIVIAGRTVVEGGVLVSGDLAEISAVADEQAARLWKRMEAL
jgi:cytosine/adenosine deaminase-related metal-dependent hydrolase